MSAPRRSPQIAQTAQNGVPGIPGYPEGLRAPERLPLTISEADFQRLVVESAMWLGWKVAHFRPAQVRTGRWVTPIQGHVGFPDLVLSKDGRVICAELKRHGGKPTPGQVEWLAALGGYGRLWSPKDWASEILPTLRGNR